MYVKSIVTKLKLYTIINYAILHNVPVHVLCKAEVVYTS